MSAGSSRSGSMPACCNSSMRRAEPEASTSFWKTLIRLPERCGGPRGLLFEAVGDAALGQVVGGHLDQHLVACEHADTVLAHAAGSMSDDLMLVFELHPEHRVGQQFGYRSRKLED